MSKTFETFQNQHFVVLQFGVRVKKITYFVWGKVRKFWKHAKLSMQILQSGPPREWCLNEEGGNSDMMTASNFHST